MSAESRHQRKRPQRSSSLPTKAGVRQVVAIAREKYPAVTSGLGELVLIGMSAQVGLLDGDPGSTACKHRSKCLWRPAAAATPFVLGFDIPRLHLQYVTRMSRFACFAATSVSTLRPVSFHGR